MSDPTKRNRTPDLDRMLTDVMRACKPRDFPGSPTDFAEAWLKGMRADLTHSLALPSGFGDRMDERAPMNINALDLDALAAAESQERLEDVIRPALEARNREIRAELYTMLARVHLLVEGRIRVELHAYLSPPPKGESDLKLWLAPHLYAMPLDSAKGLDQPDWNALLQQSFARQFGRVLRTTPKLQHIEDVSWGYFCHYRSAHEALEMARCEDSEHGRNQGTSDLLRYLERLAADTTQNFATKRVGLEAYVSGLRDLQTISMRRSDTESWAQFIRAMYFGWGRLNCAVENTQRYLLGSNLSYASFKWVSSYGQMQPQSLMAYHWFQSLFDYTWV